MREVETKAIGCNKGAGLFHMISKHIAQNRVKYVCGRVIQGSGLPFFLVHAKCQCFAFFDAAGYQLAFMNNNAARGFYGFCDFHLTVFSSDPPLVTCLASCLAIEWRHRSHKLNGVALVGTPNLCCVL